MTASPRTPGVPVRRRRQAGLHQPRHRRGRRPFPVADARRRGRRGRAGPRGRSGGASWASAAGATGCCAGAPRSPARLPELAALMHAEGGKPRADAIVEAAAAIEHLAWAANNAKRVLGAAQVRGSLHAGRVRAYLEYQPYGVIGVIGPWNYPVLTPMGSIAYALAAGNAVVFKPSEYTPAVGRVVRRRVRRGRAGAAGAADRLRRRRRPARRCVASGVDKIAFTGSTATGKKIMAACAETLTPVLLECGGKDAHDRRRDADVDAAADACVWGGMTNAGQTCVGIERVYVVDARLRRVPRQAGRPRPGSSRVGVERRRRLRPDHHARPDRRHPPAHRRRAGPRRPGGRSAAPTRSSRRTCTRRSWSTCPRTPSASREETFGPTLTVTRVADADEAVALANATAYGLGGAVFGKARGAWRSPAGCAPA